MEQSLLLCKECKHSFTPWSEWLLSGRMIRCRLALRPAEIKFEPVRGSYTEPEYYERCASERLSLHMNSGEHCGPRGRFWEPRHKRHLFKLIAKEY